MRWSWQVLLLAAAHVEAQELVGCFFLDSRFSEISMDHVTNPVKSVFSKEICQRLCQQTSGCQVFQYLSAEQECYLGAAKSELVTSIGSVSGPARCPEDPPACSELPNWPYWGDTPENTHKLWPSGANPTKLQCWPWNFYHQPGNCRSKPASTLETNQEVGICKGLTKVHLASDETCEMNCARNVMCPSWAERIVKDGSGNSAIECLQGLGTDCFRGGGEAPLQAGRQLKGSYRVLAHLQHVEVKDLTKMFDLQNSTLGSHEEAIKHCQNLCLSLLPCEVWQYHVFQGCFIENVFVKRLSLPPTSETFQRNTPFGEHATAGEYLQRICLENHFLSTVPPAWPPARGEGLDNAMLRGELSEVSNQEVQFGGEGQHRVSQANSSLLWSLGAMVVVLFSCTALRFATKSGVRSQCREQGFIHNEREEVDVYAEE